jgi:hypothetical protein
MGLKRTSFQTIASQRRVRIGSDWIGEDVTKDNPVLFDEFLFLCTWFLNTTVE